jgi:hypothetical protein
MVDLRATVVVIDERIRSALTRTAKWFGWPVVV